MYINPKSNRTNPFRKVYDDTKFTAAGKNSLPSFPFLVDIELTNACNLQCIFCGQQAMQRKRGFMTEDCFKKIIDECAKHQTPIRLIRWGEPFLHKEISNFIKYIKDRGLLLHITNNGLALTTSHMEEMVKHEVDSLVFSFQGATKEEYELMRNNAMYDKLKNNILKMIKIRGDHKKPFIHISSTVTNEPKFQIDGFVNFWGNIVDSVDIGKTNLSRLNANQIKSLETLAKLDVLKKQETIKKVYCGCKEVYQKLSVDWDGQVTCCCGDYDNFLTVGSISNSTLKQIWDNSEELKLFRNLLDKKLHKSLTLCSTCYHTYDSF